MLISAPSKSELTMAEVMAEQELVSIVREACDSSGLDRREIALRLGIHRSGVSKLLNTPRNMTVRMAARVLRAAGFRLKLGAIKIVSATEAPYSSEHPSTIATNIILFDNHRLPRRLNQLSPCAARDVKDSVRQVAAV
jgi:transcriptional regulator with XRE-family HTH domain